MKRCLAVLLIVFVLSGCGSGDAEMQQIMEFRQNLLQSSQCTFEAAITADYADVVYHFSMECLSNKTGDLSFRVTKPDSISGITGVISEIEGKLTFDDVVLAFQRLADGQITPVSAPWVVLRSLRSGYLTACGKDEEYIRVQIDDSFDEDALQVDVWFDQNTYPIRAEILWQGRRILTVDVNNFEYV